MITNPLNNNLTKMVEDNIRTQIEKGDLKPGEFVLSERQMCDSLKVSRVTVRRGLDRLVTQKLLLRVPHQGYRLPLSTEETNRDDIQKSNSLIFLATYPEEEFFADKGHMDIWKGARLEAMKHGRSLLLFPLQLSEVTKSKLIELQQLGGGILVDHNDDNLILSIQESGLPVVQVHYAGEGNDIDRISQDDLGGMIQAVNYLAAKGYKRIGYLDNSQSLIKMKMDANSSRRLAGYQIGCARNGLECIIETCNFWLTSDSKPVEAILKKKIDVILISNRGILKAVELADPKGKCPLVVWGETANYLPNEIAQISWDKKQMGKEAVIRLVDKMSEDKGAPKIVLIPTFIVSLEK
jgi:DNA-binding LacI/PurR family transcriptional regulator